MGGVALSWLSFAKKMVSQLSGRFCNTGPGGGAQLKRDWIGRKGILLEFDIYTYLQSAEPSERLNKPDHLRMNIFIYIYI